ncbi:T9SS type A sorting domain-containing protein (plasmid) [Pedobacter sp. BS3]|uniref:T9SS type A sorting domain-containing protein n=1 Tax=Pedobacter sp. BS3 TaxID=2567937 RepID=UPI0011ED10A7|nr:T9SS type A sorting domain-containing protein [Pedobacter sp. BS3]TZF86296.1 T9SS type A sorting domain-containing protein [Pedobacter sp. BS3]
MKKLLLLTTLLFCIAFVYAQTAFTSGNLVVYRYNSALTASSNTKNIAVFLDEYKPDGTLVRSIPISATTNTTTGDRGLTGINSGHQEGTLTRSADGRYIIFCGYEIDVNATTTNYGPRVIGRASFDGTINTATAVKHRNTLSETANMISSIRAATSVDGTTFWVAGTGLNKTVDGTVAGMIAVPFELNKGIAKSEPENFSLPTYIGVGGGAFFNTNIFYNQLYYSTTASVYKVGTGVPTSSSTGTLFEGFSTSSTKPNPFQFILIDTDNDQQPDLMYLATDNGSSTVGAICKYKLESGSWVNKGSIWKDNITNNMRWLAVKYDQATTTATIYCTTAGTTDGNTPSALYKVENALNDNLSNSTTMTKLATAPANTSFRGVALAPEPLSATPVKLSSFNGKLNSSGSIHLTWSTASEQNNSYFEILRSADKDNFTTIGNMTGNGTSNTIHNYSFTDEKPLPGTNYYQLNQVDFDGKSEKSTVIAINAIFETGSFRAFFKPDNMLELSVTTTKEEQATFYLTDASGKQVLSERIFLQNGKNNKSVVVNSLPPGIYIATLVLSNNKTSIKLIK